MLLPLILPPIEGESLSGYLLRLSSLNGYDGLVDMARLTGVSTPKLMRPLTDANAARLHAVIPQTTLDKVAWHRRGSSVILPDGSVFPLSQMRSADQPLCPHCLANLGCVLALWEIALVVACTEHEVLLVGTCDKCGRSLTNARGRMLHCDCGAPLVKCKTAVSPPDLLGLARRIATPPDRAATIREAEFRLLMAGGWRPQSFQRLGLFLQQRALSRVVRWTSNYDT